MPKSKILPVFFYLILLWLLASCNLPSNSNEEVKVVNTDVAELATSIPTSSPEPARPLQICLGQEPISLFLYGDLSVAARNIRQAIYDGPFDYKNGEWLPVILEKTPNLENGDIQFETLTIKPGDILVDALGKLVKLDEDVNYFPAGCNDFTCALVYSGQDVIQVEQQVVHFTLREGLVWSDGASLSADDSVFSYEIAHALYPNVSANTIPFTYSYSSLDQRTVEWRGVPGYRTGDYAPYFFSPLPRHIWGGLPLEEILTAETSNRLPIGWGPYVLEEWVSGDHISLRKNPNYFRASENLPRFEQLIYRFYGDPSAALAAMIAGNCDILDETLGMESQLAQLQPLQQAGQLVLTSIAGQTWEHLDFGISSVNPELPPLFQTKQMRQAIALCIDRQQLVDQLSPIPAQIPHSFVQLAHPLYHPGLRTYAFDPATAGAILNSLGWMDVDGDPTTPRAAQGVTGVMDGMLLEFSLLTTTEPEKQRAAQLMQASLANCGIQMQVVSLPWDQFYQPGPDGRVFGRNFQAAQFAWSGAAQPPCFLYTSAEIPGPYPQFPKGWGGANISGYSYPEYDQACQLAQRALPDSPDRKNLYAQAQSIFSEDLPSLPLYPRANILVTQPLLCGVTWDATSSSSLWNLENLEIRENCQL